MSSNTPRLDLLERNYILNGNMDFWQRGTSFGPTTGMNGYHADRYRFVGDSSHTYTVAQSTDVPTQAQSSYNSTFSWKLTNGTGAATAAGGFTQLQYKMEGYDYQALHARKVRLQFWAKSSVSGTYGLGFANGANNRSYVTSYTLVANTWTKVAVDLQLDGAGTWNFDNTTGLWLLFNIALGSNFQSSSLNSWQASGANGPTGTVDWAATTGATFQFAQVMLIPQDYTQAGSTTVDIPFQRAGRSLGQEMQMCQRYYEKSYALSTAPGTVDDSSCLFIVSATARNFYNSVTRFNTQKRATPTVTIYSSHNGTAGSASQFTLTTAPTFVSDQTGMTNSANDSQMDVANSSNSLTANVHYGFHWAADAEL